MTTLELIKRLLDLPLNAQIYVGKGMGPVVSAEPKQTEAGIVIIVAPGPAE